VILNRGTKNWGSDGYRAEDDVCRFVVKPERHRPPLETMAVQFENVTGTTCHLTLAWEDWKIAIQIVAPLMGPLRQQIEANLKTAQPQYWLAAQFYFEYDKDNAKALDMIEAAIRANEAAGRNPYWQYFYKARILTAMGKNQEAIEMAQLTARYAAAQGNRSNYVKQAEDLIQSIKKK
jgi:tetratricopeptide (TPR) repeat protein